MQTFAIIAALAGLSSAAPHLFQRAATTSWGPNPSVPVPTGTSVRPHPTGSVSWNPQATPNFAKRAPYPIPHGAGVAQWGSGTVSVPVPTGTGYSQTPSSWTSIVVPTSSAI